MDILLFDVDADEVFERVISILVIEETCIGLFSTREGQLGGEAGGVSGVFVQMLLVLVLLLLLVQLLSEETIAPVFISFFHLYMIA